jgi:hypothetical protein
MVESNKIRVELTMVKSNKTRVTKPLKTGAFVYCTNEYFYDVPVDADGEPIDINRDIIDELGQDGHDRVEYIDPLGKPAAVNRGRKRLSLDGKKI